MKITQVRNATQLITFAGKKFLIDPMLAKKDAYPGFAGTACSELRIPIVELPLDMDTLLDVDAIIVTHTHLDHWDAAAVALIPKDKLIYVQNENDENILRSQGFTNLAVLSDSSKLGDISLIKTICQHGTDEAYANPQMAALLGDVCGVVFQHPDEKTLYLIGDSIWIGTVADNMRKFNPAVVIMNTGWAHVLGFGPIIFGKEDILKVHRILPEAHIVATHMEAVNHCLLTRQELLAYAHDNQVQKFISAPEDGESVTF
ncbi:MULTISPECIES: MBL fold metallo-hydrolase [Photorhabdus]|uniref:MBL fold metallo-hydrolase n=1 Tax=Photorhabdus kayaii TaxID=230088 RepID=A0ABX0B5L9_9GAMM|nr:MULTISPECIES: MBL fold metallo-hydrolase [Photorhabdus]MCC8374967.1 MBL fold metallo-hydrolase [Photorhabdus bodei]MCT8351436.1 MBL fold metallo-hydrolase [Photorhabdus kayaii]MDB6368703.1 MBL fold metallo-hydrolase [Photorhabdus bodei]NDL13290.1 MBL fold metallo-hydrolase [Photorhabdus kayaii]NDL27019.1 MBL fold metallo-hydrolase [Photorhabdus kayaii]